MKARRPALAVTLAALLTLSTSAAIEALTLREMLGYADDAVVGTIVDREVFRVDHAVDGTMYFTTLTVAGESLLTGEPRTVPVTFYGGITADGEGWTTSITPAASDTALGRRVVAFWSELDALGFGVEGNALIAAHGGLFQIAKRGSKEVVLGRGRGFAIEANVAIPKLRSRARAIDAERAERKREQEGATR